MKKRKYIKTTSRGKVYIDELRRDEVRGSGLTRWDVSDGDIILMERLSEDEKFSISGKPIVAVRMPGSRDDVLRKFVSYIDILPDEMRTTSRDIDLHNNDTSVFVLHLKSDYDVSGYSTFYTLNHSILPGLNRYEFISLCTDVMRSVIHLLDAAGDDEPPFDYHRMAIVAACYNLAWTYRIIPSENISEKVDFIIKP